MKIHLFLCQIANYTNIMKKISLIILFFVFILYKNNAQAINNAVEPDYFKKSFTSIIILLSYPFSKGN